MNITLWGLKDKATNVLTGVTHARSLARASKTDSTKVVKLALVNNSVKEVGRG